MIDDEFNWLFLIWNSHRVKMYITEIIKDSELVQSVWAFLSTMQEHQSELGVSSDELTELQAIFSELDTLHSEVFEQKLVLAKAVIEKDEAKQRAKDIIAHYAQSFRAKPSIPDSLLANLDIPVHKPAKVRSSPKAPSELQINSDVLGNVCVRWNRNGNSSSTIFTVEISPDGVNSWQIFTATNKTSAKIKAIPGQEIWFRVNASRNNKSSSYCMKNSLWAGLISRAA